MKEKLSALMDGELDVADIDGLLAEMKRDASLSKDWYDWHQLSDNMQEHPLLSPQFMTRFSARLAAEPTVVAPQRLKRSSVMKKLLVPLTAAASIAFVGVAAWQTKTNFNTAPAMVAVQNAKPVDKKPPAIRAYLAAHSQESGNVLAERDIVYADFGTENMR
ncbi:sigma-E factor negative regulatory protein [Iodobacter fluviatilis]|uniref:Anti-RNA polymerase sigma factor SigE n=1 Tax=Iodobacter fluviatilis TaxID=537 RepID=A0A377QAP0_9NEIS|nr:sigma-E factor negative regulatory protein [Iodobacter fluviatilis]TCU89561.1 RseA-like anti sigma(E) protein [Iodobacter fluviatilis]STQ90931.1 anti-RNA polymerase sigma factor SigE [Iodobacter fluviatilis]